MSHNECAQMCVTKCEHKPDTLDVLAGYVGKRPTMCKRCGEYIIIVENNKWRILKHVRQFCITSMLLAVDKIIANITGDHGRNMFIGMLRLIPIAYMLARILVPMFNMFMDYELHTPSKGGDEEKHDNDGTTCKQ